MQTKEGISMLFVEYPKCSTCRKAAKWLSENGIEVVDRDIKNDSPSYEELKEWHAKSNLPLKKFFNTCGMVYREKNLKDRLKDMSEEEMLQELASDGMLVKRPILVGDDFVLVGFKEEQWKEVK